MSKEDSIEVTGTILEKFPSGLFSVQLEHDRVVLAHLAGRLRRNRIRVLAGRQSHAGTLALRSDQRPDHFSPPLTQIPAARRMHVDASNA